MIDSDKQEFSAVLIKAFGLYDKKITPSNVALWFAALNAYDIQAVRDALHRHVLNPDNGQFPPRPADIIRLIEGGSEDRALLAWTKVDYAVRCVGPYQTVCFDDPIIHLALRDMGGWIKLCEGEDQEWPFIRNTFITRYRGYCRKPAIEAYPRYLTGITDATNQTNGLKSFNDVHLIGDDTKARLILQNGTDRAPGVTLISHAIKQLEIQSNQ